MKPKVPADGKLTYILIKNKKKAKNMEEI